METYPSGPKSPHGPKRQFSNKKTHMLLAQFVMEKVQQNKVKDIISASLKDFDEILIEELQKDPPPRRNYISVHCRNVDIIMYSLDRLQGFYRYRIFNSLDIKDIKLAAGFFKHAHYNKGDYIFTLHQASDNFVGIIRGSVSIRGIKFTTDEVFTLFKKKQLDDIDELIYIEGMEIDQQYYDGTFDKDDLEPLILMEESDDISLNDLRYNLEIEKTTFTPGMCLGEWGIIDRMPRTASAYCKEATDIFYLEKDHFLKYLSFCFIRSVANKKCFINQNLPGLAKMFHNIIPIFVQKNDIIYTQFDQALYLYIVYQGECSYLNSNNVKSKDDLLSKKIQWKAIHIVSKGGIIGLECMKYFKGSDCHSTKINYKNNIIASKDFTVLYRVHFNLIGEMGYNYRQHLKKTAAMHDNTIQQAMEKIDTIQSKIYNIKHKKKITEKSINDCSDQGMNEVVKYNLSKIGSKNMKRYRKLILEPVSLRNRLRSEEHKVNFTQLKMKKKTLLSGTNNETENISLVPKNEELPTVTPFPIEQPIQVPLLDMKRHHHKKHSSISFITQSSMRAEQKALYNREITISPYGGYSSHSNHYNTKSMINSTTHTEPTNPHLDLLKQILPSYIPPQKDSIPYTERRRKLKSCIIHPDSIQSDPNRRRSVCNTQRTNHKTNSNYNSGYYSIPLVTKLLSEGIV